MDLLITHQANLRIILSTAKKLDISPEKAYVNIDRYGNTSAATIPIAMTEAYDEGRINEGDTIVLVGFGSGMTWGASIVRY
jgi:3-oxoacyl-[acyl-carrier-protein] synthase-3